MAWNWTLWKHFNIHSNIVTCNLSTYWLVLESTCLAQVFLWLMQRCFPFPWLFKIGRDPEKNSWGQRKLNFSRTLLQKSATAMVSSSLYTMCWNQMLLILPFSFFLGKIMPAIQDDEFLTFGIPFCFCDTIECISINLPNLKKLKVKIARPKRCFGSSKV